MLFRALAIALVLLAGCDDGRPRGAPDAPDAGPPGVCDEVGYEADPIGPRVLILLDRSTSMRSQRWMAATAAVETVAVELEERLALGLAWFPGEGDECAVGEVVVEPALRTARRMRERLVDVHPDGMTPTAATLERLAGVLPSSDRPAAILLVTDGGPNCEAPISRWRCADETSRLPPRPRVCFDDSRTVTAAAHLLSLGVSTYVVGLDPLAGDVLDAVASAGGTGRHVSTDPGSLLSVLETLTGRFSSCEYELLAGYADEPDRILVTVDGHDLPRGPQGWEIAGDRVRLLGDSCDLIRDGEPHEVEVRLDCSVI